MTSDGTTMVEVIQRSCSNRRDGVWLRVTSCGYHLADVRTVDELAGLGINLADLHEADLIQKQQSQAQREAVGSLWA